MFWITIEQIKCFQAVASVGSFTKAASELGKAKSAIIYSINSLEDQLNFNLLDRTSYRPALTSKGKEFLRESDKLIKQYEELMKKTSQIASNVETRLAISVSGIYGMSKIYPIIKDAMKKYPSTEIIIEREILSGEKMLMNDQVDMAIYANIHAQTNFESKKIDSVEMLLVISHDHEFNDIPKKEQSFSKLFNYPQIIQRSTIQDQGYQIGIHKDSLKWRVTDTPSKKEIIENGLGWGRLPADLIQSELKNKKLKHLSNLEGPKPVNFSIGRKKEREMGEVAKFIWDRL